MLFVATVVLAQNKPWNEKTRDAAYEAPNSYLQKKWSVKGANSTIMFAANGILKFTILQQVDDIRVICYISGKYTRKKDRLTLTFTGVKSNFESSYLAGLSARKRDEMMGKLKEFDKVFASEYVNRVIEYVILRLDKECAILAEYDTKMKIFNDLTWTTLYPSK